MRVTYPQISSAVHAQRPSVVEYVHTCGPPGGFFEKEQSLSLMHESFGVWQ